MSNKYKYPNLITFFKSFTKVEAIYMIFVVTLAVGMAIFFPDLMLESTATPLLILCSVNYFSAADCVVLPYKTATQSGVTQICYNFCTPVIVTRVGGLAEIVPDGVVGYVCDPSAEGVRNALECIFEGDRIAEFSHNMIEERKRFSWSTMCDEIEKLYNML